MGIVQNKLLRFSVVAGIVLLFVPQTAWARTLDSYLEDLQRTAEEFKVFADESVDFREETIVTAAETILKQTLRLFPAKEEIDYGDQKIAVDNAWLQKDAAAFGRETDPIKRKRIIRAIGERIYAISVQVENLEYVIPRNTSKDEEKRRLAGILNREEYRPADPEAESPAARFYRILENWIASLFPRIKPPDPNMKADLTGLKTVLQVVIFVLVGALLVYLVIRFGPQLVRRYRKESKTAGKRLILGEEVGPETTTANLFAEAETLARKGDIRGAIRKGYISLLFELSERRMIGLAKHKTNRDYLRDLVKHERIRSSVSGLTLNYERHWYGHQEAAQDDWQEFQKGYIDTLSR